MQSNHSIQDGKNIIVGPDYEQISKQQTNTHIIQHFISYLFSSDMRINLKSLSVLTRNFMIILFIKTLLEESKSYLDKFRFTNLDIIRYGFQYLKSGEKKYEIIHIANKWIYANTHINMATLTPFLESVSIYVSQPSTYYYSNRSFLVKVIVETNKITFKIPDVVSISNHIDEILAKHREILIGGKTTMLRVTLGNVDIMQFNPLSPTYAFETDNYKNLCDILLEQFMIDNILKIKNTPTCINFDGPPGTGKTTFASYVANKGIFDRIIIYNMVQGNNIDFRTMLTNLERTILNQASKEKKSPIDDECENILLMFDEIDKWLDSYICTKIDSFRSEARVKKESKSGNNSDIICSESYVKLTPEEETDKIQQLRKDFLDKLYNLCEGQIFKSGIKYVIVLNTNNFEGLFKNTDSKYDALRTRFIQYHFENIGKNDVVKYIKGILTKLKEAHNSSTMSPDKKELYKFNITKLTCIDDDLYDLIPQDIRISYRDLTKLLGNNCFDVNKLIKSLSNTK